MSAECKSPAVITAEAVAFLRKGLAGNLTEPTHAEVVYEQLTLVWRDWRVSFDACSLLLQYGWADEWGRGVAQVIESAAEALKIILDEAPPDCWCEHPRDADRWQDD